MHLEYKAVTPDLSDDGRFSAIVATFGAIDRSGDVIVREAFARSLGRDVPVLLGHQWQTGIIVGAGRVKATPGEAVLEGRFIVDDDHIYGRMAYAQAKALGHLQQFSIGFQTLDAVQERREGKTVRVIRDLELFEVSLVPVGAQPGARVVDIKAVWSAAFINDLPDSAFAVILPGGEKDETGRTTPRDLRKLPHHGPDGEVDLPHLRNALARLDQTDMPEEYREQARRHLERHARALGIGGRKELVDLALLAIEHADVTHEALMRTEEAVRDWHRAHCPCGKAAPYLALAEAELSLLRLKGGYG
ncbi:MAG TPA: HK97 family phage prohead protease [Candidatus Tectomicrobia bacterium]|nr:HK97 family phage prohead protease [Candidatus Tectomicrobia bacterium]